MYDCVLRLACRNVHLSVYLIVCVCVCLCVCVTKLGLF